MKTLGWLVLFGLIWWLNLLVAIAKYQADIAGMAGVAFGLNVALMVALLQSLKGSHRLWQGRRS